MKSLCTLGVILVASFNVLLGQNIQEAPRTMSLGTKNSFYFLVDNLNAKEVEKLWMDYLKDSKAKVKKDRKTGEVFADDANLPAMSANLVDVYATFTDKGNNNSEAVIWFDLGGAFLSNQEHPEKIQGLYSYLGTFTRQTRVRKVELEMETEELKLKDLNKEFARLQKEQDRLTKDIADFEQKLVEARKNLELNQTAQTTRQTEIQNQSRVLELIKDRLKRVE